MPALATRPQPTNSLQRRDFPDTLVKAVLSIEDRRELGRRRPSLKAVARSRSSSPRCRSSVSVGSGLPCGTHANEMSSSPDEVSNDSSS